MQFKQQRAHRWTTWIHRQCFVWFCLWNTKMQLHSTIQEEFDGSFGKRTPSHLCRSKYHRNYAAEEHSADRFS